MSRMIDNMLFLAQAEQPDRAIQRHKINVAEEIQRLSDYFEDLAADRGISFHAQASGTVETSRLANNNSL